MRRIVSAACAHLVAGLAVCALVFPCAAQETWPARQVTLLVPYPAGGYIDAVTRLVAEALREKHGQPFVVVNRTGGNGQVALGDVSRAAPDGYTLLTNNEGGIGVPPALDRNFKFDPAKDYTALAQIVAADYILITRASLPARTVTEFIALAKSGGRPISYASPGTGSTPHVSMEYFARQIGAEFLHVPFAGAAPAMNDLAGGQIDSYMPSVPTMFGQAKNEKLRMLAVLSKQRAREFPEVPTMEEAGVPGFALDGWLGLFGPPGMSDDLRTRISRAIADVVRDEKLATKLRAIAAAPVTKDAATFAPFYLAEVARWKKFSQETNIKFGD